MEIKLFHGTISNFKEPNLDLCKKISDYGQAFYCTPEKELAKEWASKQNLKGFIHEYSLELEGLSVLDLTKDNYSIFKLGFNSFRKQVIAN